MSGVYFGRGERTGLIKIGWSRDVERRARALSAGSEAVEVLCVLPGGTRLEALFLAHFDEFRVRGEWFSPSPAIMAMIDEINGSGAPTKKADLRALTERLGRACRELVANPPSPAALPDAMRALDDAMAATQEAARVLIFLAEQPSSGPDTERLTR